MIVVRVELHSAITGEKTELARMEIVNDGTADSSKVGHYNVRTLRGRSTDQLDQRKEQRAGRIEEWRRLDQHVWVLVAAALRAVGYIKGGDLPQSQNVRRPLIGQPNDAVARASRYAYASLNKFER